MLLPMKLKGFEEMVGRVRRLESALHQPASFYASMRGEYHRQATQIAEAILTQLRPPKTKPEDWKRKTDRVVARVTTVLLFGGDGIIFRIAEPGGTADGGLAPNDQRPDSQVMSFDDIKDWIRAGQRGEPGGKRITADDEAYMAKAGGGEAGINAVAAIVMKAYYSTLPRSNYTRLRAAIQRYMLGNRDSQSSPLLDAIATAWREHFAVVIRRDLKDHAVQLCKEF
jgi:hypothetical protein